MIHDGDMVRRGGGPPMRVANTFNGMARCVFIDSRGRIVQRFYYEDDLSPLWLTLQPRSLWPDPGQIETTEIEREEREAAVAQMFKRRVARKNARKARRSNKLTREAAE